MTLGARKPDVVVIGAGFGGLAAALRLAELGADVVLCETLRYPGGCASTFTRSGYQFESGATLFSGLGDGQLFSNWNDKWDLGVRFDRLDPLVELRTGQWSLGVPPDRASFIRRFGELPGANPEALRGFFGTQRGVADALWKLFEDPSLLPPLSGRSVLRHLRRSSSYGPVLRWMGRPLSDVVSRYGLAGWEPLRVYLDAVSQITVQASSAEAEAPFAMAAVDYFFRGTGHVHGGIGSLAWALVHAIAKAGGSVRLANRVRGIRREGNQWRVDTRQGELQAQTVVANVLPQSLSAMTEPQMNGKLRDVEAAVESGWGAAMRYLVVDSKAVQGAEAHHLQLVDDDRAPFVEGNHVFCSISAADEHQRAPNGQRTVTVSTHVPMHKLRDLSREDQGAYVTAIQGRMRETMGRRAPELLEHAVFEMTASPRTFARFTGRHQGYVGGVPRRVGLKHYRPRALWPRQPSPGLYLVGDSVLLGQSTLAVALGGVRTAERIASQHKFWNGVSPS
ncbi:MAG: FAD-dependent oxidoreductase [Myxococcales bacterium]|nr:MAG: FAD-dependent oxidoreductase [Myxococcales bacterium]